MNRFSFDGELGAPSLFLNNQSIPGSSVIVGKYDIRPSAEVLEFKPLYDVIIRDYLEEFARFTIFLSASGFGSVFSSLALELPDPKKAPPTLISNPYYKLPPEAYELEVEFRFRTDLFDWDKPFTFRTLAKEIELQKWQTNDLIARVEVQYPSKYEEERIPSVDLICKIDNTDITLGRLIDTLLPTFVQIYDKVVDELLTKAEQKSLITLFSFPSEVRVSCEQYLLYFIKFLRDVGVEATAKIEERAGKTLFSVTPTNEEDALEKIKQALEVYLHLPASPATTLVLPFSADIETQQLAANIHHLQGQLMLTRAAMQAQNATLEAKDTIIEQQRHLINQQIQSGTILLDSLVSQTQQRSTALLNDSKKENKEESEEIVRGVVSIKKWDLEMLEFDFPNMIRKLKAWFKERDASK